MRTDLIEIPNIVEKTKKLLMNIGITRIEDSKGKNIEDLYYKDCTICEEKN